MEDSNSLTNNFPAPSNVCNSFALLYHKLKVLEEDLHQRIHLKNNILFAEEALLEKELKKLNLI